MRGRGAFLRTTLLASTALAGLTLAAAMDGTAAVLLGMFASSPALAEGGDADFNIRFGGSDSVTGVGGAGDSGILNGVGILGFAGAGGGAGATGGAGGDGFGAAAGSGGAGSVVA